MADWFARPILSVTDVAASLRFYVDRLGFTSPWHFDENGKTFVAQVDREGCVLILGDQWPEKVGKGLIFISLNVDLRRMMWHSRPRLCPLPMLERARPRARLPSSPRSTLAPRTRLRHLLPPPA
jgi:hypothetical protein